MDREGIIKFSYRCSSERDKYPDIEKSLIGLRNYLWGLGLVGERDGVGYGNVSVRAPAGTFLITASQTGHLRAIGPEHLVEIVHYNLRKNFVECRGEYPPSSESLTHASAYEGNGEIGCIAHVHDSLLWRRLYGRVPTTPDYAEYGTVELSMEVRSIVSTVRDLPVVIVMGGHRDGLLFAGRDCGEVRELIDEFYLLQRENRNVSAR